MTCPKCEKETTGPDFCGHCAAPLKEKCPECGEMEPIGRKFCEKEFSEYMMESRNFLESKLSVYTPLLILVGPTLGAMATGFCISFIAVKVFGVDYRASWFWLLEISSYCMGGALFVLLCINSFFKRRAAAAHEFYNQNPKYEKFRIIK